MTNLIFFGTPGAGKGTQAELISQKYNLTHLSSGHILRAEMAAGELGTEIKSYVDKGILVPNELVIAMMEKAAKTSWANNQGVIFDGYPRNLEQAESLQKFFAANNLELTAVINLEISEEEAKKRILLRGQNSGRSDDNPETISERFKTYHDQTKPLIDYYQNLSKIKTIDGAPDIETVAKSIHQIIDNL
ncbi:MAG: adenylate kinase [Candidatus Falkowbacteria bacterium]|nr:MAG: adenylate kinase [Candidatus Falkowbacteria bacterium]